VKVEKLKRNLTATNSSSDSWTLAVLQSAFIQGCNSDFSIDMDKVTGENIKYDSIIDKLYIRRVPEVVRSHIFPRFRRVWGVKDVIKACEEEGIILDGENPADTLIVYDEFLKLVNWLRKEDEENEETEDKEEE